MNGKLYVDLLLDHRQDLIPTRELSVQVAAAAAVAVEIPKGNLEKSTEQEGQEQKPLLLPGTLVINTGLSE
jgi:hypothetical protein